MDKGVTLNRTGSVTFTLGPEMLDLVLKPGANRVKPETFALLKEHFLFKALVGDKLIAVEDITPAEAKAEKEKAAKALRDMTKQDLVLFAQKEFNLELSMSETKEEMIEQIEMASDEPAAL